MQNLSISKPYMYRSYEKPLATSVQLIHTEMDFPSLDQSVPYYYRQLNLSNKQII